MNNSFKPLALAAAVAALSAGAVGVANAQEPAGFYPSLGDTAFVPYYTVEQDWVTGVHIINTSAETHVIKLRLRRAADSLDILDFNLILSPYDEWVGTITGDETEMRFVTDDVSCTAPKLLDNGDGRTYAPISGLRLDGAQEGYLEVIGMGAADAAQPISVGALHAAGVPANCDAVRDNFYVESFVAQDPAQTANRLSGAVSTYTEGGDVLKVSYFIRDAASGIEFGNNAIHFEGYSTEPMMTHQQFGLENYAAAPAEALYGWDFPDVRGGSSLNAVRASIDVVRDQLGAAEVVNDWSYNPATGAATDWVVTFPGQYALEDFYVKTAGGAPSTWDYRELPVAALFTVYDREEGSETPDGLNFSPSQPGESTILPYEVNVIQWGGQNVLDSKFTLGITPGFASPVGWASLKVTATAGPAGANQWCDVAAGPVAGPTGDTCALTPLSGPVAMVGFAAWERTFSDDNDRNYGRIVEHSFSVASS